MKKLLLSIVALALAATAYVAAPFATAWSIREAVRTGNSAYLEAKIEWDTVRESLRRSLTVAALGPPETGAAAPEKPGLWQRIKARVGRSAVDNLVESYVTPEGLPQLFTYRKLYRNHVTGEDPALTLPWHKRFAAFWSRVKRAEFLTPTEFKIEMADRHDASRHYVGLLKLRGLEWKLAELEVHIVGTPIRLTGQAL
jgi:hypothetical protein